MKKRFFSICLAVLIAISFCSCGASVPDPADTVKGFSEAMKSYDLQKMASYTSNYDPNSFSEDVSETFMDAMLDYMKKNSADMKYSIAKTEMDRDAGTASVSCEYTYKDSSQVISSAIQKYLLSSLAYIFSPDELTDEKMTELFENALSEALNETTSTEGKRTVVYDLVLSENKWFIKDVPEDALNVMTGEVFTAFDKMGESFNGESSTADSTLQEKLDSIYSNCSGELFSNEFCTVTLEGVETDFWGDLTFNVKIENITSDKEFSFRISNLVVNGYKNYTYMDETVLPGKTTYSAFSINSDRMALSGIENADKVEIDVRGYDEDTYQDYFTDKCVFYPTGLTDSQIEINSLNDGADVLWLYKANGIRAAVLDHDMDDGDCMLYFYLENMTDKTLEFSTEKESVNSVMFDGYFNETVESGIRSIEVMTLRKYELEEIKLEASDIEQVEFTFCIEDYNDWFADPIAEVNCIVNL